MSSINNSSDPLRVVLDELLSSFESRCSVRTKAPIRLGPPMTHGRHKIKERPKPRARSASASTVPKQTTGNAQPPSPHCHDECNADYDDGYYDDDYWDSDGFDEWYYYEDDDGCVDSSGQYFDDANDMFAYGDCDWGSN